MTARTRAVTVTIRTRTTAAAAGVLLTLTLGACGDTTDTQIPGTQPGLDQAAASTGEVAAEHNDADVEFAQLMIVHHEGAIGMADLAVGTASTDAVRALAERISAAQGPEIDRMSSWLTAWGEDTEADMDGMDHGGMDMGGMDQPAAMAELEGLSGAEFDRRVLELMIEHHDGAIEMARTELADGASPQALALARSIIDDQTAEIAEMEGMLEEL